MTIISKKFKKGIILQGESSDSSENEEGSLFHNSSDGRIKSYVEGAVRQIVTNSQSQVLTNKILSGPNIEVQNPSRLDVKKDTKAALQSYASSASNGQLCFAIDSKQMFQVIDGVLKSVGGGGADNVSSLLIQTFDEVEASDFVQTGLVIVGTDTINGERSARLIHQAGTSPANDQSFKQTITVDRKFRGNSMQLSLAIQSTAAQGNVTLKVYDETNSANIIASEQITTGSQIISGLSTSSGSPVISGFNNVALNSLKVGQRVTGSGIPTDSIITAVNSSALTINIDQNATASATVSLSFSDNIARKLVNFTIPQNCASLSYTITALPEAGLPETYVDDIVIELAETALLETAVEVPVVTAWQGYIPTFQGFGTAPTGPTNIEFEWRQVGESVEIRGKFTVGTPTVVEARVGLPAGLTSAGTSLIPSIQNAGIATFSYNAAGNTHVLIEPSVSYVTFGYETTSSGGLQKTTANNIASLGGQLSLFASVPCSGLSATTTKTIPLTQSGLVQEGDSIVRLSDGTFSGGFMTFTTITENQGDAFSVNPSTGTITVLKDGTYTISASAIWQSGTTGVGIYINGTYYSGYSLSASVSTRIPQTVTAKLTANTAIRIINPSTGTVVDGTLVVTYQGSLKQVSVNPNSKITIPTSELRFEGASSRGSTATVIVKFDTIAKLRGDAFTVESDSVLGTRITMKKAGKLDINASCSVLTNSSYLFITKNLTSLTVTPSVPSEIISASQVYATTAVTNVTGNLYVNVGDIIRIAATGVPAGDTRNVLNLSFQEQDISVSVTNTLPQFSESDSSIRMHTANGYGSTGTFIRRFSSTVGNLGSAITYNPNNDEAINGASFRINENGVYNISYSDNFTIGSVVAISKNANGATNPVSLSGDERLAMEEASAASTRNVSWQGYLQAGDVIKPHTAGGTSDAASRAQFTISKVGKPNVTGVDVTPFVNVPQPEIEHFTSTVTVQTSPTSISAIAPLSNSLSKLATQPTLVSGGLEFTILKNNLFTGLAGARATNNLASLEWFVNGISRGLSSAIDSLLDPSVGGGAFTEKLFAGDKVRLVMSNQDNTTLNPVSFNLQALSDQILTAPETFSTDTASLTYAGSGTYTLSTLANAPVGTFITFTYAINTNTRTQTLNTAPNQLPADMNANGILLYTRAFNAASSAGQPAAIAIQIGKGLKGKSLDLYKSAAKTTSGELGFTVSGSSGQSGLYFNTYDEKTGILYVDSGAATTNGITSNTFFYTDTTNQTSGYLVINASKNPALTGMNVERVSARGEQSSAQSIPHNTITTVIYDANKPFDTNGALNAATGVFTAPESGYYQVNALITYGAVVWGTNTIYDIRLIKNNITVVLKRNVVQTTTTQLFSNLLSDVIFLNKNDTLKIDTYHNRGSATTLHNDTSTNYFSVTKTNIGGRN